MSVGAAENVNDSFVGSVGIRARIKKQAVRDYRLFSEKERKKVT